MRNPDPKDRDWEADTKHAASVITRTWLTSSGTGIVMVNPRNLETVASQFQNPVVVLVSWSREQFHETVGDIKLERSQEVTSIVRDPKKPDEPEERDDCLQSHRSRCGKHCR